MKHRSSPRHDLRWLSALLAVIAVACTALFTWGLITPRPARAAASSSAFSQTEAISRTHLIDGVDDTADTRTVKVTASVTRNLRDRQGVTIDWKGAHPTGGVYFDDNSPFAVYQEYPVAILQCRGVDSSSVPAAKRLSPETCFTPTPDSRYQGPFRGLFPSYRLDRYATKADRRRVVGAPDPLPAKCITGDGAERWVPFVAVDGTRYDGGFFGCGGLAPEQSVVADPLNPSNATFGATGRDGTGSARFVVQDGEDNASLGCSATVACSIVVIPIMGISCDAAAADLPPIDRPTNVDSAQAACTQSGFYEPGQPTGNQNSSDPNAQVPVSGLLWWSASNWRNRITIPITFAQSAAVCDITGGGNSENVYGSEYMLQATQQWAPKFCLDKQLFRLQHTQTSEVQAKNLLATGVTNGKYLGVKAAFQGAPPDPTFQNPIVQAPTALTGFAIGYVIDDAKHHEFTQLKLDARLLAKLMTMSYPAYPEVRNDWAGIDKYKAAANNPLDVTVDPEFEALNPGAKTATINQLESSATLFLMSSDSDVITALTSYINADPDARSWLAGKPDPWGMVVNPNYKGISLPTHNWPLLDSYYNSLGNDCIADDHTPVLPLLAGQVSDPAQITFNMQFGISNAQVNCVVTGATNSKGNRRLTGQGPQQPGIRFLLGLVSLADAERYQINTAALESQKSTSAPEQFTDATGRTFVQPTPDGLRAAGKMMKPDDSLNTWPVPYDRMRNDPDGAQAYPGTMLMSTDVPTAGLTSDDADRYAKFLRYVAGPGQVQGEGNGQLPAGYLPITAANGVGGMAAYTEAAAAAVEEQHGAVPKPSHPVAPAHPSTSSSSPPSSRTTSSVGPGPAGGGATPPAAGSSSSPTPSRASSRSATASASPSSSPVAQRVGSTPNAAPDWLGFALPALAVAALISGLGAALTFQVGRR